MSKPLVVYPDPEVAAVDLVQTLMTLEGESGTVAVGVPEDWTPATGTHVQVAWDGTPELAHPVVAFPTVRITVWAAEPSEAKRVALLLQGHLLAHVGGTLRNIRPLTGVLPAQDPATRAELATFTVRCATRSTVITPAS